ncbi:MAG: pyridoxal phosphate-dependent aminotransferase [Gammaproteobacteria bacterium]|nr:pyridoxal phosphate-dependent aminotransferase [Gammaproteobacteria bacterium]
MNNKIKIANRMERIRPFYVMELLARAKELESSGRSIVHMEIGEPDFPTPAPVVAAAKVALDRGYTRYLPATGLPELKCQIAGFYRSRYGLPLDPARIVITPGSSGALQLVLSVLIEPGESVLMADPGYPCNRHFVQLVGGVPKCIPVGPDTGYQLTAEMVKKALTPNTKAVMVASPSNPTGTLLPAGELEAIHAVVRAHGGILIVDEIYQGLIYEATGGTALSLGDDLFVINSFSKYFGMTGWRIGWMVAPESYVPAIDRLAQNIFISTSSLAQYAAIEAFSADCIKTMEQRRDAFKQRRDYLLSALSDLGFNIACVPQGAFYLYADCSELTQDSSQFSSDLLETAGVAVTPGKDFGDNQPERHIRFAYTTEISILKEGVDRIAAFLAQVSEFN